MMIGNKFYLVAIMTTLFTCNCTLFSCQLKVNASHAVTMEMLNKAIKMINSLCF